jgi:glutamate synthase (NADPH/NADH) large chain
VAFSALPQAQGLYDPAREHDACGVAFVVDAKGRRSHRIIQQGITALANLDHRGAAGAEANSGDGAGLLLQIPDGFLREVVSFDLPPEGGYAVGNVFLPADADERARAQAIVDGVTADEGLVVLGWRDVPTDNDGADIGPTARQVEPHVAQVFIADPGMEPRTGLALDRLAYVVRRRSERDAKAAGVEIYYPSLSCRTLVYKGMLTTAQLPLFFPDLTDERVESAIALVHSRFSTNTFPSWPLAHPYRFVAHNGEINTVRGNRNWMRAREALLSSPYSEEKFGGDVDRLFPICTPGASDSASFDEVLELLHLGGRSLPHAVLMMIPEAWENNPSMNPHRRAFYQFHAQLMEPWDGPAAVCFTDGTVIGAVLDRNGLRPARWWQTKDDLVVLASEAGVLDIPPGDVVAKGRLQPGRMFLVDTVEGRIIADDEVKAGLAAEHPYADWLHAGLMRLPDLPDREHVTYGHSSVQRRQQTFGYTEEDLRVLLTPMARTGGEALGSMGTDTPIAVLSQRPRLLYDYFNQLFAQVTNPPLDAIREEIVTAISNTIGPEQSLLEPGPASCRRIVLPFPVLDNDELSKLVNINEDGDKGGFQAVTVSGLYRVADGAAGMRDRLDQICQHVSEAIEDGARLIVTRPVTSPRSRRCCSPQGCTTTSSGSAPGPRSVSSSSPGTHARSITSRCCSASARPQSTRTWRSSRSRT